MFGEVIMPAANTPNHARLCSTHAMYQALETDIREFGETTMFDRPKETSDH